MLSTCSLAHVSDGCLWPLPLLFGKGLAAEQPAGYLAGLCLPWGRGGGVSGNATQLGVSTASSEQQSSRAPENPKKTKSDIKRNPCLLFGPILHPPSSP